MSATQNSELAINEGPSTAATTSLTFELEFDGNNVAFGVELMRYGERERERQRQRERDEENFMLG